MTAALSIGARIERLRRLQGLDTTGNNAAPDAAIPEAAAAALSEET